MLRQIIAFVLASLFIFVGLNKLTPQVSPHIHNKMVKDFHQFYKVNPLVEQKIINSDPDTYRKVTGITEVICGILILIAPIALARLVYFILTIIMIVAVYSHYRLGQTINDMVPALVSLGLLLFQLIISGRGGSHDKRD